jgi:predicted metal-dependent phosphoesterase TrpH
METIERLCEAGYMISYADVRKKNATGNVNRAHIAAELLKKGYVESISHAFQTILSDDGGFYVPPTRLQLTDAIQFLKEIDAIPVLAHPLKDVDEESFRKMLPIMIEAGLMGMETYHSSYDAYTIERAVSIAEEFKLLQSGGSDFHGENKPNIQLGRGKGNLEIPMMFYENIRKCQGEHS